MSELLMLLALGALAWLWTDSMRSREVAIQYGRRLCLQYDWQLLDDTVSLARIRLARDHNGRLVLKRSYSFEFSREGVIRYEGRIVLLGRRLLTTELPPVPTQAEPPAPKPSVDVAPPELPHRPDKADTKIHRIH